MALRSMTVQRYEEIRRRLAEGRSLREIARALGCSRRTVRDVRDGERLSPEAPRVSADPLWMAQVDWPAIIHDLGLGHPLKFLWEERAQQLITYPNFWKQFYRKFPQYRAASVTAREFEPGERVEVDYAGDPIEWIEIKTGEIRKAWVFVAGLGFSQLLFAWAAEDMRSRNWLASHRRMFAYYGGVPHVTVPDCLKQGVLKCHLYDPDLNPGYAQVAADYATAVVPARPDHPKDKAIVEGLVKILMRYLRFRYRRRRFTSLLEINRALAECIERINDRRHTRFGISRRERFETIEKAALKPLPIGDVDCAEWKDAKLHADCYLYIEGDYYSAPHIHRHKKLRVKISENQVEIFLRLERLAIHPEVAIAMAGASRSIPTSRKRPRLITRQYRKSYCRNRASSTPNSISCSWSCSTAICSHTCDVVRASCASAPRRSTAAATSSPANASPQRSPACVAIASSASRTSKHCSIRRINEPCSRKPVATSCDAPAIPCCVTSVAVLPVLRPFPLLLHQTRRT